MGPAGGFLTSLVLRAAGEATNFARPVSLSCQFLRTARFDQVDLQVTVLRTGKRSETLRVDMLQHSKLVLSAIVWVAPYDMEGMQHDYNIATDLPDPAQLQAYEALYPTRSVHPFMQRIERRPIDPVPEGDLSVRAPELGGFDRLRSEPGSDNPFIDYARVMLLLDTFAWLATYPAHPSKGPSQWIAPNLDYYYRFHRPLSGEDWLYMKNTANIAHDGLIATDGEIRNTHGELLASGSAQLLCSARPEQFS